MGKFSWFLIGGALGAGAALALAPKTGEEMRALVAEKADAALGEAKDFGAGFPDSAKEAYKSAVGQGSSLLNDATSKVKGATGTANDADADELRQKIEAARQRIAAQVMENAEQAQASAEGVKEAVVESAESVAEEAAEAVEAKHAAN